MTAKGGFLWAGLAAVVLLAGCSQNSTEARASRGKGPGAVDPPQNVPVIELETREVRRVVNAVGSLWPFDQVTVSSEVEGHVQQILADVGDLVRESQVLVKLSPEELQYELDQQTAALRQAMVRLGLSSEEASPGDPEELPEVKRAAAILIEAEQKLERARELHERNLISKQQLDEAEARFRVAQAERDAIFQQVRHTQALVQQYRASVALARKKLRDTEIRAPFAGAVRERLVSVGQSLNVRSPVMTLVKLDPLKLRADVPEKMSPWVRIGQVVEVGVEAYPNQVFSGKISRLVPAVSEDSRSLTVEALVDNRQGLLKPGFFAKVKLTTEKADSIHLLPESATAYAYGVHKAFAVENGRVKERDLSLGERFGDQVEILSGIRPGEWVALQPQGLKDGQAVTIQTSKSGVHEEDHDVHR
ncbi:MAG: efflux RND transporter periplasmic adaptor subunit [Acidobacteria bacterium]|nr:efflux RND transporter periplasmic adaptor subunit [Acidobacteriota bacterium]